MTPDERRQQQLKICDKLVKVWLPVAENTDDDDALKAIPVLLRVMDHAATIAGIAKAPEHVPQHADPLELARRVQAVSPILVARLEEARKRDEAARNGAASR